MAKFEIEARRMTNSRFARCVRAFDRRSDRVVRDGPPPPALAGDEPAPSVFAVAPGAVKSLQLGVGRSVIVDLPEDAGEIFVGEPKVANAIVRSARRIYVSTLAAGQTTIFALAADGRKIAVLEISVGRDVGELTTLLNAAIPGNDIHVRTVGDSIILTGSVASAGRRAKSLRHRHRLSVVDAERSAAARRRGAAAARRRPGARSRRARQGHQLADHPRPRPGQPARDHQRNPPRDRQAARRQHDAASAARRVEQASTSTIPSPSTAR